MKTLYPLRLRARREDKIWGARNLAPYFEPRSDGEPALGEAWLTYEQAVVENGAYEGKTLAELMTELGPCLVGNAHRQRNYTRVSADPSLARDEAPGVYFPILAKLLFTSDVLSVQVHPPDEWALENAGGPGKTEMWYVIEAEPGAKVALGLTEALPPERLAEAARTGEIEQYLNWEPVKGGDVIFVPAGLLHTLGAGLKVCEIQQNSDLTYRFWDFNRPGPDGSPRQLHIDEGSTVTAGAPWAGAAPALALHSEDVDRKLLAACPYFAAEKLEWSHDFRFRADVNRFLILIILDGTGSIAGEPYGPGTTFLVPAHADGFDIRTETPTHAVCAYEPDLGALRASLEQAGASQEQIRRVVH